jgi:LEA14-like dessication related protein
MPASPRLLRLLLLLLALPLAACFLARPVEKPTAQVRDVSLGTASFTTLLGEVDLDVQNPNGFGLPLSSIEWELSIGNARAVTGKAELSQTIPARASAPVATTLRVDLRNAIDVATALGNGAREYHLAVRLHFATQIGDLSVDLQHRGSLSSAGGLLGSLDNVRLPSF